MDFFEDQNTWLSIITAGTAIIALFQKQENK